MLEVAHNLNKQGMTVVLITHFMEEVLDCDTVVVMSGGRVVKTGAPMDLFEDSALLNSVGLTAPRTIALSQMLHEAGFAVTRNATDAKKLGGEVCQNLKK